MFQLSCTKCLYLYALVFRAFRLVTIDLSLTIGITLKGCLFLISTCLDNESLARARACAQSKGGEKLPAAILTACEFPFLQQYESLYSSRKWPGDKKVKF